MFVSATVKDFQSVESATIEFPQRVSGGSITTIVGPSSTGKSAFLRALHTLIYNTSSVSARTRAGAKTLQVEAVLSDGREVCIKRGSSLSTYEVGEEVYSKAGTTAPDVIAGIFRMQPGLHMRFQFSAPYLLSEPPATVAAAFAQLTQAKVLREASREGARLSLRAKQAASLQQEEAGKISRVLEEDFADLDQHRDRLEAVRENLHKAQALEEAAVKVQSAAQAYVSAVQEAEQAETLIQAYSALPGVRTGLTEVSSHVSRAVEAQRAVALLRSAQEELAVLPTPVPDLAERIASLKSASQSTALVKQALSAVSVASVQAESCEQATQVAQRAVAQLTEALAVHRSALQTCPTCGQVVQEVHA